jgi:hypothetical protein
MITFLIAINHDVLEVFFFICSTRSDLKGGATFTVTCIDSISPAFPLGNLLVSNTKYLANIDWTLPLTRLTFEIKHLCYYFITSVIIGLWKWSIREDQISLFETNTLSSNSINAD